MASIPEAPPLTKGLTVGQTPPLFFFSSAIVLLQRSREKRGPKKKKKKTERPRNEFSPLRLAV